MLKTLLVLLFCAVMADSAIPESGYYEIEEMLIRYTPSEKPNGSAWDPLGGAPDLFLQFSIEDSVNSWVLLTTGVKENSGTSASWSSAVEIAIESPLLENETVAYLSVNVWDSDTYQSDFVDSGRIAFSRLVVGENTIECDSGSRITFVIDGPHNEGRIHP
jgi:hypothetical protein